MSGANAVLLVDADPLAYAAGFVGQDNILNEDEKVIDVDIRPFQNVSSYIDNMVEGIMEACDTNVEPFMFLTGKTNFRDEVATLKPYKGNRVADKPFHLENARMYIRNRYSTYLSKGCEADDLLATAMTSYRKQDVPCILCTIDKDLLQVAGWHYKWETWNSGEVKPHLVDEFGFLTGEYKEGVSAKTGKPTRSFITKSFKGEGYLWFMAQLLTGDTVDNIAGLEGCGAKKAYECLKEAKSEREALEIVLALYQEKYGETYEERVTEQARLVYMIRELDKNSPDGLKHWSLKDAKESAKD